jgi:hypothetical protein
MFLLMKSRCELVNAQSERRSNGYEKWRIPECWIQVPRTNPDPLYFEIFRLENSQVWKVSLIASRTKNPRRLSQLRQAARFLQTDGWGRPQGATAEFEGNNKSRAVFLIRYGRHDSKENGQIEGARIIETVLGRYGDAWENVLAVQ